MAEGDFSLGDIFPGREEDSGQSEKPEKLKQVSVITEQDEVTTSYLLVNTLLSLLIQKNIINEQEVNSLLKELHSQYRQTKKGG